MMKLKKNDENSWAKQFLGFFGYLFILNCISDYHLCTSHYFTNMFLWIRPNSKYRCNVM